MTLKRHDCDGTFACRTVLLLRRYDAVKGVRAFVNEGLSERISWSGTMIEKKCRQRKVKHAFSNDALPQ